jgi:hypothetical protein
MLLKNSEKQNIHIKILIKIIEIEEKTGENIRKIKMKKGKFLWKKEKKILQII